MEPVIRIRPARTRAHFPAHPVDQGQGSRDVGIDDFDDVVEILVEEAVCRGRVRHLPGAQQPGAHGLLPTTGRFPGALKDRPQPLPRRLRSSAIPLRRRPWSDRLRSGGRSLHGRIRERDRDRFRSRHRLRWQGVEVLRSWKISSAGRGNGAVAPHQLNVGKQRCRPVLCSRTSG